jgi:hypothetical protein
MKAWLVGWSLLVVVQMVELGRWRLSPAFVVE